MNRNPDKRSFTLIELLIVVAIIGILAAIAVPNFVMAQVKSKVARVYSEFNSAANTLSAYQIDSNQFPPMRDRGNHYRHYRLPNYLTTPIAYFNALPHDPFQVDEDPFGLVDDTTLFQRYRYHHVKQLVADNDVVDIPATLVDLEVFGNWRVLSLGPDRLYQGYTRYDPSNGVASRGDIYRSEKGVDQTLTADERVGSGTFR